MILKGPNPNYAWIWPFSLYNRIHRQKLEYQGGTRMEEHSSFIMYLISVNIIGFILMYIDKRKAMKKHYRIPERTFWALAILGSALGTYIGMKLFRHKTKHRSFMIGMPILFIVNIVCCIYIFFFMS